MEKSKYITVGRTSILKDSIVDISFEEAKEKFPRIREDMLFEVWKVANPKGKMKKSHKKED